MNLSAPFIRRPVATVLLSIGLMLCGLVAMRFLPIAALPGIDFPVIVVTASRPGASPEAMASSVAAPLERRLGEIAGVSVHDIDDVQQIVERNASGREAEARRAERILEAELDRFERWLGGR